MTQEQQQQKDEGPSLRSRAAVNWWLKKWGRQVVADDKEPLNREDVERLIKTNGGTAEELYLVGRHMEGIDLGETDLSGAILVSAILERANLWGANLRTAQLDDANLQSAQLFAAKLQEASMSGADLRESNLSDSDLRGAVLRFARLQGVDLDGTRISGDTDLGDVEWDKGYISVLERKGDYESAIALYRRLKEWYHYAGMSTVAGEFHYREREANRKLRWQRLGNEFRDFKRSLAESWRKLRNKEGGA